MKVTIESENSKAVYDVDNFEEIAEILKGCFEDDIDPNRIEFENNLNEFDHAFETLDANWQVIKENFGDAHKEADEHFEKMIKEYNAFLWSLEAEEDD